MKFKFSAILLLRAITVAHGQLIFDPGESELKLADTTRAPDIRIAPDEALGVERTANDVARDFGRVVGVNGTVTVSTDDPDAGTPIIIAGTIGHSTLIDQLISDGKLDVSEVEGKWESYVSRIVEDPFANTSWALAIAGSDRRGTIYGLYDLSEQMGVSPWYWWADVPVKVKTDIWVSPEGKFQKSPSVKYRGFFINDENPALLGWVNANFGRFNSEFYSLVFELCLRLKGNYIWPAMWGKSFYVDDPNSGPLANEYGVIMGTSHHEPMARSESEQNRFLEGDWDWRDNEAGVVKFFTEGIDRAKNWDTMWTMGMRGKGDAASPTLTAPDLEDLIQVQQSLLSEAFNTSDVSDIPQTWVLYKEVSDYYVAGLEVPDSVTLLWTDDNSGNLIRVPLANETDRTAGAGVYYHFDYVGAPRSYKWINTIQLVKTWEQMHLAYNKNARTIWIANVGDLKPLEIPLTQFMDMAYDMERHSTPDATTDWLKRWAATEFGSDAADSTASIMNQYGILIGRRKYELLSNLPFAFSTVHYDEAEQNLASWQLLLDEAERVHETLDEATRISFFQMVLHPILAGKTVVELYTKTALNALYYQQGRASTNLLAQQAHDAFAADSQITDRYHELNGSKWNSFVDQVHIGYTSWNDPPNNQNIMPSLRYVAPPEVPGSLGVAVQGTAAAFPGVSSLKLRSVDPFMPATESRYIDIFSRENTTVSYTISSNASYVTLSHDQGSIGPSEESFDIRSVISVDWDEAPNGVSLVQLTINASDDSEASLMLPVNKTSIPTDFSGFVESNGVVSMEAAHYTASEEKNGVSYVEVPHYGRTLSGVKPWPVTMESQDPATGPALTYSIYTTTSSDSPRLIVSLGSSHNHDPTRWIKFAYSVDGSEPVAVRPVPADPPYKEGAAWNKAVVENGWTSTIQLGTTIDAGAHELSIWLLEPGVVLQKVALDMGGYQSSALGAPESWRT